MKINTNLIFNETQRFRQLWLWVVLLISFGVMTWFFVEQAILNKPTDEGRELPSVMIYVVYILFFLVILLFWIIRLDTRIDKDGVGFRFYPLQQKYALIRWEEIDKAYVREYNALLEYGGWGYRLNFFGKGKAINVCGNKGLQLVLKNGKKLLIGTQKADEVSELIS